MLVAWDDGEPRLQVISFDLVAFINKNMASEMIGLQMQRDDGNDYVAQLAAPR
jgi:hypothetical protein